MKIVAITLLRKGSKRLPGKNIKPFCGRPLYFWTIKTALELGLDHYIATDYEDLDNYGYSKLIAKPEEFAQDKHRNMDELRFYHQFIKADFYILLQATSPIRDPMLMSKWICEATENEYDSAISATISPKGYYYIDGEVRNISHRLNSLIESGGKPVHCENGSFYWFSRRQLENGDYLVSDKPHIFEDRFQTDIDDPEDWKAAEQIMKKEIEECTK